MTIYNLYIFDRHCQCIYYQKWTHKTPNTASHSNSISQTGSIAPGTTTSGSSRFGGLTTSSSRFSTSSPDVSNPDKSSSNATTRAGETQPTVSGMAAGSVISIEEEAKLVYGVIYSLRNFVRKLSGSQDGFISYRTSTYRLHYYETPTGLKFVMNSDVNTESLRPVLKQIYVQLYVEFVVKNGLMCFEDTRWEVTPGLLPTDQDGSNPPKTAPLPAGNISNELFRIAVDRFIRSLPFFE